MRSDRTMSDPSRLVTAEELEHFPDDDHRYELVEGRIIRMSPVGYLHGRVVMRFGSRLERHVRGAELGEVLTEVGFKLKSNPDTVRAPDVAFIRRDRIPESPPKGSWRGAADLAVEVLSPEDTPLEIRQKTMEYLARGTSVVVVIDPGDETVSVFRQAVDGLALSGEDVLDLDDVVPGFRCAVRDIFQ
jgi:Uma2 family endonuclease